MVSSGGDMNGINIIKMDVKKSKMDRTKNLRFDRSDKPMFQKTKMFATFMGIAMDPMIKTLATPNTKCRTLYSSSLKKGKTATGLISDISSRE